MFPSPGEQPDMFTQQRVPQSPGPEPLFYPHPDTTRTPGVDAPADSDVADFDATGIPGRQWGVRRTVAGHLMH